VAAPLQKTHHSMGLRLLITFLGMILSAHVSAAVGGSVAGAVDDSEAAISRLRDLKTQNQTAQQESQLRQEFFDRVIFQINTNYKQGSLPEFLAKTYSIMAARDANSPMHDFLLQASELMRMRQEKFENPIDLTFRFMQSGSILKPLSAEQFLAAQSYTNGERSETVTGMSREELGEYIDRHQAPRANLVPILKNVEIRE
jgi:hypothetical protein